jgi:uncharacterized protein YbjT (DUF2867 family)
VIDGPVLVTGANGFIASRLVPRLLRDGYSVRVLARQPERLAGRAWLPNVDVRAGSTADEAALAAAMHGVQAAYYLIHSMSRGRGYTEVERQEARRFASAAAAAGVRHIIYLGGLADPKDPHLAPHMRSRIETGEILRQGRVPVTEFRAGVIAGAGSISFEMVRFLTECFPILPGPRWLLNWAQPIASENVIDYLVAGLEQTAARGGIFEIGGPEQMRFGDVMLRYARARGLMRRLVTLPGIPIWWMALCVDRLTPVPRPIAAALIGGLQSDSRVVDDQARRVFPAVKLLTYEAAVRAALEELVPERVERVWEGLGQDTADFRHEGFVVDYRTRSVGASARAVYEYVTQMGPPAAWPSSGWLWRLRGWIDNILSNEGAPNNARPPSRGGAVPTLSVGTRLDFYRVEAMENGQMIRLRSTLHAPGGGWLEWRVDPVSDNASRLTQTAFFAPRGLPGFLYWLILSPMHRLTLGGLIGAIQRNVEAK